MKNIHEISMSFWIQQENIYAIPIIHYNMEMAAQVKLAYKQIQPDCVAVELAETMEPQLLHAASRLPDISVVMAKTGKKAPLYYLCEPCDAAFEALRSAEESQIPAFCIDLDIDYYPEQRDQIPDPYAIERIGLKKYYEFYSEAQQTMPSLPFPVDRDREIHMARRLKELSFSFDRILFVSGMAHTKRILELTKNQDFPKPNPTKRDEITVVTLTEESCRKVMGEYGWISSHYENWREQLKGQSTSTPDRQKLIYSLYKAAARVYIEKTGNPFPSYHFRNLMKFTRNYARLHDQLLPDLFKILTAAKGCVDHRYAYETWELATAYPYLRNIDNLPELNLSVEEIWKHSKVIKFHLTQRSRKEFTFHQKRKDRSNFKFIPSGLFSICSYQPEDKVIENFGSFLRKKGVQIVTEEAARVHPFSNSLEDGIDMKETIRHWYEKKLYVKVKGKPPGNIGSVVVIFDEDLPKEGETSFQDAFPWLVTWIGEHDQESDMAFYATPMTRNVIGPGISRCEYGGFMMIYPSRRLLDVWSDPDYAGCKSKAEVLLVAAIDYSLQPSVVYVAQKPPRSAIKSFAQRFGKKIIYLPIGQLSQVLLNKIRAFHVLDGRDKREIAGEYIF